MESAKLFTITGTAEHSSLPKKMGKESLAAVLYQVECPIELRIATIVGVRNVGDTFVFREEISHFPYLILFHFVGSERKDGAVVLIVHYHNVVEVVEVG